MELTPEQKQSVAQWVKDGDGLAEVQRKLQSELGIKMTYMDVRFLVLDLGVEPEEPKPEPKPEPPAAPETVPEPQAEPVPAAGPADDLAPPAGEPGASQGKVSVELDRIMQPGALVSGSVVFSDGVSASWSLDQMGRLALNPGTPDYRPTDEDVQAFQLELQNALAARGF
jgi:hypothetical protein